MNRFLTVALLSGVFTMTSAFGAIHKETVTYKDGDTVLEGYLAYDESLNSRRPGIVVVHNWMGVTDETKSKVDALAQLGYVALAADIYGKGVRPASPKDAGALAGKFKGDRKLLRQRAHAAVEYLKTLKHVDTKKLAATGYCFGGTTAIEMARNGENLKGVVSFHGGLDSPTPADGKNIRAKVLALHGAIDPYVKAEDLAAFQKELNDAKVDYQLVEYAGAVHSFTEKAAGNDISKGAAYNEAADRRSWEAMKTFFAEIFK